MIIIAPTVTKSGYNIRGWYSDSELMIPYSFDVMPEENLLLYAKWVNNTMTGEIVEAEDATLDGSRLLNAFHIRLFL